MSLTSPYDGVHFIVITLIVLELSLHVACTLIELEVKFMAVFMLLTLRDALRLIYAMIIICYLGFT